tara:strand:+ start:50 stop:814 length:765 start_codon:yes stop_codon:yes gene_type:complete
MIKELKPYILFFVLLLYCLKPNITQSQYITSNEPNNLSLSPMPYGLNFKLPGSLLERKEYKMAAREYRKLIITIENLKNDTSPVNNLNQILARAYMGLGFSLDYLNEDREALAFLKKSIEMDPSLRDHLMLQTTIGAIYGDLGLKQDEIVHYRKIIKINPSFYQAYFNLALALGDMGKMNEAINILKEAIIIKPTYAKAYLQLAKGSEAVGSIDNAIGYYLMAKQLYSKLGRIDIEKEIHLRLNQLLKKFGKTI